MKISKTFVPTWETTARLPVACSRFLRSYSFSELGRNYPFLNSPAPWVTRPIPTSPRSWPGSGGCRWNPWKIGRMPWVSRVRSASSCTARRSPTWRRPGSRRSSIATKLRSRNWSGRSRSSRRRSFKTGGPVVLLKGRPDQLQQPVHPDQKPLAAADIGHRPGPIVPGAGLLLICTTFGHSLSLGQQALTRGAQLYACAGTLSIPITNAPSVPRRAFQLRAFPRLGQKIVSHLGIIPYTTGPAQLETSVWCQPDPSWCQLRAQRSPV